MTGTPFREDGKAIGRAPLTPTYSVEESAIRKMEKVAGPLTPNLTGQESGLTHGRLGLGRERWFIGNGKGNNETGLPRVGESWS